MLDEYRQICKERASVIPGWEKLSKNDLCRAYVANEQDQFLAEAYWCAIMYRYWGQIQNYYYACNKLAYPEDCYNWLVRAVTYTLKHRRWEDPNSSIYQDPDGPDKMINRSLKSARLTFYQYINRYKRKEDFGLLSYEQLKEEYEESNFDISDDEEIISADSLDIAQYIKSMFNRKDYFLAFMLHYLLTVNCTSVENDSVQIDVKKLKRVIKSTDEQEAKIFSNSYDIPYEQVLTALPYLKTNPGKFNQKIEAYILKLRHDPTILQMKEGN